MKPLVLTHTGQLGDFVYTWPIAQWLYKTRGQKIHFVLPSFFGPFRAIESLLKLQDFTEGMTLVDYKVATYAHGGQPYKFNPNDYGVVCEQYFNLGIRAYPNKFITEFVADEHGLGWDKDWKLNLATDQHGLNTDVVTDEQPLKRKHCFTEHSNFRHFIQPQVMDRIDLSKDVLWNARKMVYADNRHCFFSAMAVILYFAQERFYLYRQPGHPSEDIYFPNRSRYEIVRCPA